VPCSDDALKVMPYSSRGVPDKRETWPDLVAPGKSGLDPLKEGTSFAAPRVAEAVAQIIHLLKAYREQAGTKSALKLSIPEDTLAAGVALGPRLAGKRLPWDEDGLPTFEFDPAPAPKLVKQLLRDFTRPVPGAQPHEVGAGALDSTRLRHELSGFERVDAKILSINVFDPKETIRAN